MTTYELLREGEWTTDGRMLEVGAVRWEQGWVSLVDREREVIGEVHNIRREGNSIVGDVMDVQLPPDTALTCDLRLDVLTHTDDGDVIGHSALLLMAHVNDKANYPWPQKKEGEADAR